jgi:hypothetical protein
MVEATAEQKELVEGFENSIKYDIHALSIKFDRSYERKVIEIVGKEMMPCIISHLENNPPSEFMDLHIAWGMMICNIGKKCNKDVPRKLDFSKTSEWISWAKREFADVSE